MYDWIKIYQPNTDYKPNKQADEIHRLKGDLKRVTEERDILKKAAVSMNRRMETNLVLNALLMAVWHRKPSSGVIIHSDQGSQFNSEKWKTFLKAHNLQPSMSRRGNCYDNAVAESFFHLLKTERIRRTL
jgi:transposase InsO family protein